MIDLHCHLLPGLDDGAADMATALRLARLAVAEGFTHLVCTPHIHPHRYNNTGPITAAARRVFASALADADIPLKVGCAAEVRLDLEIMTGVVDGSIPLLGTWRGQGVLLLEFPHHDVPVGAERLTQWLLGRGILPMLAHPERNRGILARPEKLHPFLAQGCLLQVTAASLIGHFGPAPRDLARHLLLDGLVAVLASDAHNERDRPPLMRQPLALATEWIGESKARALVMDNPWEIVKGQF
jgi:protein-tyrosine phosphatase